jgi:hypothetical protein
LFEEAERTYREVKDAVGEGEAVMRRGAAFWLAGGTDKALELYDHSRACFGGAPDLEVLLSWLGGYHAMALVELGHVREGMDELERLFDIARSLSDCRPLLLIGSFTAQVLLEARRDQDARDLCKELLEVARHNVPRFVLQIGSNLGLAMARTGDPQGGLRYTEMAIRRLRSHKACEDTDPQALCAQQAEVLELAGRKEAAQSTWLRAVQVMREIETRLPESLRSSYRDRPINRRIAARSRTTSKQSSPP